MPLLLNPVRFLSLSCRLSVLVAVFFGLGCDQWGKINPPHEDANTHAPAENKLDKIDVAPAPGVLIPYPPPPPPPPPPLFLPIGVADGGGSQGAEEAARTGNPDRNPPVKCDVAPCIDDNICTLDECFTLTGCRNTPIDGVSPVQCTPIDPETGEPFLGPCGVGHRVCDNGVPTTTTVVPPNADPNFCQPDVEAVEEICPNGIDDNCDGNVDNCFICEGNGALDCDDDNFCTVDTCSIALGCIHTNVPDGPVTGQTCDTGLPGVCSDGFRVCEDGQPLPESDPDFCDPIIEPGQLPEDCTITVDQIDEDCDGLADDNDPDCQTPVSFNNSKQTLWQRVLAVIGF
jgi:hypothetical protein